MAKGAERDESDDDAPTVLPLNCEAMNALLAESTMLHTLLRREREGFARSSDALQASITQLSTVVDHGHLPRSFLNQLNPIMSGVADLSVKTELKFTRPPRLHDRLGDDIVGLVDEVRELDAKVFAMNQERADLTFQVGQQETVLLELRCEIKRLQRERDENQRVEGRLGGELAQLERLSQFWWDRNAETEESIREALCAIDGLGESPRIAEARELLTRSAERLHEFSQLRRSPPPTGSVGRSGPPTGSVGGADA